jgi:Putative transposase
VDYVMPKVALRQWVLTVPFAWRSRLGFDGAPLGAVVRKFADAVLAFYRRRLVEDDGVKGQSGAVLVVQRTSSDLRLNPHVHAVFLDGVFHDDAKGEVMFQALPRLDTEEVADVLEDAARRITPTSGGAGSSRRTAMRIPAPSRCPRVRSRRRSPSSRRRRPRA